MIFKKNHCTDCSQSSFISTVLVLWVEWLNGDILDEQSAGFLKGLFGGCNSDFIIFSVIFIAAHSLDCDDAKITPPFIQSINQSVFLFCFSTQT